MQRHTIPRKVNGSPNIPDSIDKYAEDVAKELCKRHPDIDIFELDYFFCHSVSFHLSMEQMKENKIER